MNSRRIEISKRLKTGFDAKSSSNSKFSGIINIFLSTVIILMIPQMIQLQNEMWIAGCMGDKGDEIRYKNSYVADALKLYIVKE